MKRHALFAALFFSWLTPGTPAAEPAAIARTLVFYGPATNTTMEATANIRLVVIIDGEKATATMKTEPPLSGTGKLEGRFVGGWCELQGKLDEGFNLQFRGAINARDFRGTYFAAIPGQPLQYGKFELAIEPAGKAHPLIDEPAGAR